jgi:hypothetical protein
MQFVNDVVIKGQAVPVPVFPRKTEIHHLGGAVHPLGLKSGGWIGAFQVSIKPVKIKAARTDFISNAPEVTLVAFLQGDEPLPGCNQVNFYLPGFGSPNVEVAPPVPEICGAETWGGDDFLLFVQPEMKKGSGGSVKGRKNRFQEGKRLFY